MRLNLLRVAMLRLLHVSTLVLALLIVFALLRCVERGQMFVPEVKFLWKKGVEEVFDAVSFVVPVSEEVDVLRHVWRGLGGHDWWEQTAWVTREGAPETAHRDVLCRMG